MLRSEKNVTVNVRNDLGQVTSRLTVGESTSGDPCDWLDRRLAPPSMEFPFSLNSGLIFDALIRQTMMLVTISTINEQ